MTTSTNMFNLRIDLDALKRGQFHPESFVTPFFTDYACMRAAGRLACYIVDVDKGLTYREFLSEFSKFSSFDVDLCFHMVSTHLCVYESDEILSNQDILDLLFVLAIYLGGYIIRSYMLEMLKSDLKPYFPY